MIYCPARKIVDPPIQWESELMRQLNNEPDAFFAFVRGVTETTVITSDKYNDLIDKLFVNEKMIISTQELAFITVKLPRINIEIYGIYYYILKQLAWEGINIIDVISTANEFTVLVAQDDVDKAFKTLMQLKRGF